MIMQKIEKISSDVNSGVNGDSNIIIEELQAIIHQQSAKIEQMEAKVNWFMEQFRLAQHRRYGKSSEQVSSMQLNLFNEAEFPAHSSDCMVIIGESEQAPGMQCGAKATLFR